jgi:hypothetical protein
MHGTYYNILNIIRVILSQKIEPQEVIGCIVRLQSLSALALRQPF